MAIADSQVIAGVGKEERMEVIDDTGMSSVYLTKAEIRRFLLPFREDWIFAEEVMFRGGKLTVRFRTFNSPFVQPPQHLTRNHIIMFTTQASYLLGGCLAKYDHNWPLDENEYYDLIASEQATFTKIQLRFKQFIPNKDGVCLSMWSAGHRLYKGKLFVDIRFEFDSACYGRFKAILAVDRSFLPSIRSEILRASGNYSAFQD